MNKQIKKDTLEEYVLFASMLKWVFLAIIIGILVGAATSLFIKLVGFGCGITVRWKYYYLILPIAFFASSFIVLKLAPDAEGHGTEKAIEAVHKTSGKMDIKVVPVKIISTFITIIFGGSVGEEGPATQIGAGIASFFSDIFKFSDKDRKRLVVCGIGAGFVGVFGAPVGAAIFACEVLFVGKLSYFSFFPSIIATFSSYFTGRFLGTKPLVYYFINIKDISITNRFLFLAIFGIVIGILALIFIKLVNFVERYFKSINIYPPLKGVIGGIIMVIIVFITKSTDYIGIGEPIINKAISGGKINSIASFIKMITTSVTLGSGGSGGILTPMLYIGSTSGSLWADIIHGSASFYSAIGMVSFLAACANTPVAGIIMAMELFGSEVGIYASIVCVISYLVVGHRSIYPTQILISSKTPSIDLDTNCEIAKVKNITVKNEALTRIVHKDNNSTVNH